MNRRIRTLIVDDEAPARRRVREYLNEATEIEIVGEATTGREAVKALVDLQPDLVFMDIQMPDPDGISALRQSTFKPPAVVFVTAFDEFAIDAFEVNAVDYLLKPFSRERLAQSLTRVSQRLRQTNPVEDSGSMQINIKTTQQSSASAERLAIKDGSRVTYVPIREIIWIEAEGNYARIHTGSGAHLMRESLKSLMELLPADRFQRIHRAAIVNVEFVVSMEPYFHGDAFITLKSGPRLRVSRQRRQALEKLLGA